MRYQIATLCSVYFILSISLLHGDSPATDWTHFGGAAGNYTFERPIQRKSHCPTKRWQRTIGQGMSGVVCKDGHVFTTFLVPFTEEERKKPESERTHREAIVALDAETGKPLWRHDYDAGWIESQQAFGGRSRAPQATPAVMGDTLISIGFTGIMHCLNRKTGQVIWKKNVVDAFDSTPVQFGFSASPLPIDDRIIVLAGGQKNSDRGGLVCLHAIDGKVIWNLPCAEASYATPVVWDRPDGQQIVFVTRNRIVGASADDGSLLWEYPLPGKGMTNVPTPMKLDDEGLLLSGQGIKGTQRIDVTKKDGGYEVTKVWECSEQFFYCNWVRHENTLWGSDGSLLMAIDVLTGKTMGRFRGFNDANLLLAEDQLFVFDGDGHLSELDLSKPEVKVIAKFSVLDKRCWTPPTPTERYLYLRGGDQLMCLDLVGGDERAAVVPARIRKSTLKLLTADTADENEDTSTKRSATEQILAVYENEGADAAWKSYNQLRDEDPDAISFEERKNLAELANGESLHDFAKMILQHAEEDFPKQAAEANRVPAKEITRGDNGLIYLEFAISNSTKSTIQAVVKGPPKHPFGYGLPIRPGQSRVEKWPVGTKLYRTHAGLRKDLLLTVREDFSGTTIDLATAKNKEEQQE